MQKTNNFLNKVKDTNEVPEETYPVTMYVDKNILNSEGIAATKRTHDKQADKAVTAKVITTFLVSILTLSNFIFNQKTDLQIKGSAMVTIWAPSYANIFLAEPEREYLYTIINNMSMLYPQYIDDSFMIQKGTFS